MLTIHFGGGVPLLKKGDERIGYIERMELDPDTVSPGHMSIKHLHVLGSESGKQALNGSERSFVTFIAQETG